MLKQVQGPKLWKGYITICYFLKMWGTFNEYFKTKNCAKILRFSKKFSPQLKHDQKQLIRGVLKVCSKFTGEHSCLSVISINLQSNFIEITLRHQCSPVNLLHVFRTPFRKNTSGCLLLHDWFSYKNSRKIKVLSLSLDTRRNLNVRKTFRRHPGSLLNILCTFNLLPVSKG